MGTDIAEVDPETDLETEEIGDRAGPDPAQGLALDDTGLGRGKESESAKENARKSERKRRSARNADCRRLRKKT